MFGSKFRRVVSGVCVGLMIFASFGDNAVTAFAAEPDALVEEEALTETSDEEAVELFDEEAAPAEELTTEESFDENGEETEVSEEEVSEEIEEDSELPEEEASEEDAELPEEEVSTEEIEIPEEEEVEAVENVTSASVEYEGSGDTQDVMYVAGTKEKVAEFTKSTGALVWTSTTYNAIPASIFKGDQNIVSLSFDSRCGVTEIDEYAFYGCTNLKTIDFSNAKSLTTADNYAFYSCESLENFSFPDSMSVIGNCVFQKCTSLTSVTLPAGITKVGTSAFAGCSSLSAVTVYAKQLNVGVSQMSSIFYGCWINSITLDKDVTVYPSMLFGGATFETGYEVVIPARIREIGNNAFDGSNISKIKFEEGSQLTTIDSKAFYNCKQLTSIKLPEGLQRIGLQAFMNSALLSIEIPNSVTSIEDQAFDGSLIASVTLPTATRSKGSLYPKIFNNCKNLTSVEIPDGWEYIGEYMFAGCESLSSITLSDDITEIGQYAFQKTSITTLEMPNTVTVVGKYAFSECKSLETVKFSTNVTEIADYTFNQCVNFTGYKKSSDRYEFSFSTKVNRIGSSAFAGCASLRFSAFPNALEYIGMQAFSGCSLMESITITPNVTDIGQKAFEKCVEIKKVKIDSLKLKTIGKSVFDGCSINEVEFNQSMTEIPANIFNNADFKSGVEIRIPDSVTKIGNYAFGGEKAANTGNEVIISKYTFGSNSKLTEIGDYAFQYNTAMTEFNIPKSVTQIGTSAFFSCTALTEITIPENVLVIKNSAFSNCQNVTIIHYNAISASVASKREADCIFSGCSIKNIFLGEKVMLLPAYLFYGANFAKKSGSSEEAVDIDLTVPATITEIGAYCLAGVKNLRKLYFDPNSSFVKIDSCAFYNCSGLEEINIPESTTTIGDSAFYCCEELTGIALPSNLKELGAHAFEGCASITSVTIPVKVAVINSSVFKGASKLSTVNFASVEGVTSIKSSAFEGCSSLKSISLPETVETIESKAFSGCSAMQSMDIPFAVNSIADDAFTSVPKSTKFYVVKDSYAYNWLTSKGYTNLDTNNSIVYVLNGGINNVANPHRYKEGEIITFANPSRSGAHFDGWYSDSNFKTRITDSSSFVDGKVYTIYAKWKLDEFNLTVEMNGGECTQTIKGKFTCDDVIVLPTTATKDGSDFIGWSYTNMSNSTSIAETSRVVKIENGYPCNSNGPLASAKEVKDIKIYAVWNPYQITIKYHDTKGTDITKVVKTETKYDGKNTLMQASYFGVNYEGFEIVQWNLKANLTGTGFLPGQSVPNLYIYGSLDTSVTNRKAYVVDLYAKWEKLGVAKAPKAYVTNKNGSMVEVGNNVVNVYPGDVITLISDSTDATIWYVTDSSKSPATQGEKYTDVITVPDMVGTFTVKAMAKKETAEDDSPVVTFSFNVRDKKTDWGDVVATDRAIYSDATEVPSGIWFAGVKDAPYTGKAVVINNLRVYFGTKLLEEKKDYTVKYTNNKKVANALTAKKKPTITITGKGSFKGKAVKTFSIVQADIADIDAAQLITVAANGKTQKVVPVMTNSVGYKLKKKTDFIVSYPSTESGAYMNPTEGTNYYSIIVTGKGGFTGTKEFKLKITKPDISAAKVTIKGKYKYLGEGVSVNPASASITVKMGKKSLKNGVDYTVSYGDNKSAGTGTVIIEGMGDYIGSKIATFKITGISIAKSKITLSKTSVPYTGEEIKIGDESGLKVVSFVKSGQMLGMEKDYYISGYSKNIKKGTATVIFEGMGQYSGTIKKTFKIVPAEFKASDVKLDIDYSDGTNALEEGNPFTAEYMPGGAKPEVKVSYNGIELKNKTDYTVSYENNLRTTNSPNAKVNITGKGNFKGTVTGKFKISAVSLADCKITVDDVIYEEKAGQPRPDVKGQYGSETFTSFSQSYTYGSNATVTNNGVAVKRYAGNRIDSRDIIPVGTVIIDTITGSGNYTGTVTKSFRVVTKSISNATVTVKKQGYNYNGVVPNKSDIMVKLDKYTTLNDSDYVIIDCYNNFDAGSGYLVIRGVGEYGGVKTVKFTIDKQSF